MTLRPALSLALLVCALVLAPAVQASTLTRDHHRGSGRTDTVDTSSGGAVSTSGCATDSGCAPVAPPPPAIPEPAGLVLIGTGLLLVGYRLRRG